MWLNLEMCVSVFSYYLIFFHKLLGLKENLSPPSPEYLFQFFSPPVISLSRTKCSWGQGGSIIPGKWNPNSSDSFPCKVLFWMSYLMPIES